EVRVGDDLARYERNLGKNHVLRRSAVANEEDLSHEDAGAVLGAVNGNVLRQISRLECAARSRAARLGGGPVDRGEQKQSTGQQARRHERLPPFVKKGRRAGR